MKSAENVRYVSKELIFGVRSSAVKFQRLPTYLRHWDASGEYTSVSKLCRHTEADTRIQKRI